MGRQHSQPAGQPPDDDDDDKKNGNTNSEMVVSSSPAFSIAFFEILLGPNAYIGRRLSMALKLGRAMIVGRKLLPLKADVV
jgi:hypothetical protein